MRCNKPVHYSAQLYDEYTTESVERYDEAMIRRLLQELWLVGRGPHTLIDVGTGTARLLVKIAKHPSFTDTRLIGTDYFPDMVAQARETVQRHGLQAQVTIDYADVHDMPYPRDHADFVISRSCIHHWANPVTAFQEIYRVLRCGGVALLHEPRRDPHPEALAEFNHKRDQVGVEPARLEEKYTPEEVKRFLKEAGLHKQSIVSAPKSGPGSLGFEVRLSKCHPLKVHVVSWIARIVLAAKWR